MLILVLQKTCFLEHTWTSKLLKQALRQGGVYGGAELALHSADQRRAVQRSSSGQLVVQRAPGKGAEVTR